MAVSRRVAMQRAVSAFLTVIMQAVGRHIDHMAVPHAALGDDVVGKFLHVGATALEHGDFHAAVVIEMHVQRGLRQIVAMMEVAGQPLRQVARLVVVDVDQRGDAWPRSADLARRLLQPRAGEVADRLGAVGIAARRA